MTGYAALMRVSQEFDSLVEELANWILENEADLTDAGLDCDLLNDRFLPKLEEVCQRDKDTMGAVLGEVAVQINSQGQYEVTRNWAGQWA